MLTYFRTNTQYTKANLIQAVELQLQQLPQRFESIGSTDKVCRYEFPIESMDILDWLNHQTNPAKTYWSDRDGSMEMGGIGVADTVSLSQTDDTADIFEACRLRLSDNNPNLKCYGGIAFDSQNQGEEWQNFHAAQFIIPRFELLRSEDQIVFAVNIRVDDIHQAHVDLLLGELKTLTFDSAAIEPLPALPERCDYPDHTSWQSIFDKVHQAIKQKSVSKTVLARKSVLTFDQPLNAVQLTQHLKTITPNCFHFCIQLNKHQAFIGASPERLFRRVKNYLETEALAGTKPRGQNDLEDTQMKQSLLDSTKDAREHQIVVEAIEQTLNTVCTKHSSEDNHHLLTLNGGHHLVSRMHGEIKSGVTDETLLSQLHPTPAVGGTPRENAVALIRTHEPFSRGWYSGPCGYIGHDTVDLSVGIRSGLIEGPTLSLYAGAGIVEASNCEDEWTEIENKIGTFLKLFKS